MDNDLHDIDKLFFNSLEPNEGAPSKNVWDNIDKKLNDEGNKKPGGWYIWAKRSVLFLLIIGLGFGGYQFFYKNKSAPQHKNVAATNQKELQLPINNDTQKKDTKTKIGVDNTLASIKKTNTANNLNKNKFIATDTIGKLNSVIKTNNFSEKSKQLSTAVNGSENNTNKNVLSFVKPTFIKKPIIYLHKTYTNKYQKKHLNNKQNNIEEINNNLSDNNLNYLKNDYFNSNKSFNKTNGSIIKNNNVHINTNGEKDRIDILNTAKTMDYIGDISIAQLLPAPNSINVETEHLSLQKLIEKDAASKKTASNKQTSIGKSRFYVSAFAAPEWAGFQLKDNDDQPNGGGQNRGEDTKNKIQHREDEDASLVAGVGIGYKISKRLSIESGVRYSEYDIRTDSVKLYAALNTTNNTIGYKINTSLGYGYLNNAAGTAPAIGDSMVASNLRQSVNYLSMPFLLRYETGKGRLSFNPGLGFVFNFILNSSIRTSLDNGQRQMINLQGLKKIWIGVMFTPSVYYRFSSRISFGLEPYFNYTISPINKATVVDSYPYGIGLGASLRYHF